jgi:ATP-dependent DNA helicase DinG
MASSLESIFGPGGLLESRLSNYEFRPSQLQMAEAVLSAIRHRHSLCIEAGTGTGKTLSYLIPALSSGKRVVVSTATKNLQEQLFTKDVPFLRRTLFPELKATYMKGRANYLCLRRLDEVRLRSPFRGEGFGFDWEAFEIWTGRTSTGDRAELAWLADDDPLWDSVDARSDTCTGQKCALFQDCFVTRMRQQAFEADLIVVNHALFFANLALESDEIGRILPDFAILVLDEAHEVEDIAAEHFGRRLSSFQMADLCRALRRSVDETAAGALGLIDRLAQASERLFARLPLVEGRHSLSGYRCARTHRTIDLRHELSGEAARLQEVLRTIYHEMAQRRFAGDDTEPLIRRIDRGCSILEELFGLESPELVYWFERTGRGAFLHLTPIDVAPLLRERLFQRCDTTILTSATLTTEGNFEYIRERLGIPEPEEVIVPGEFDYPSQAVLYLPRGMPEPKAPDYFLHLLRQIRAILRLTDGHAFLLFTSTQQMRRVYGALAASSEYALLCQGTKPKSQILEEFRSTPRGVLCATSSFWQGVDVQGEALRAVVIDKLPFHVPTEPMVSARTERIQRQGRNPFLAYTVPSAVITLRQGLGRLIRSRRDTGILAVLDSRLWTRRYGELFLKSLPKCPVADNMKDLENFFLRIGS